MRLKKDRYLKKKTYLILIQHKMKEKLNNQLLKR